MRAFSDSSFVGIKLTEVTIKGHNEMTSYTI